MTFFLANEAWSNSFGWAEGSLTLTERILASQFNLTRPSWISSSYWANSVTPYLSLPSQCTTDSQCLSSTFCVTASCVAGSCVWRSKEGILCNDDDLCTENTTCTSSGMCAGVPLPCENSSDICVEGTCVVPSVPSLPRCNYSHPVGPFSLYWDWVGSDSIQIAFSIPGTSYIALGIGTSMTNADIVIGSVALDGSFNVHDQWSPSPGPPRLDIDVGGTSDITNFWGVAEGEGGFGGFTIWFQRKLDTGDKYDQVLKNGTTTFIYAWGEGAPGSVAYHGSNRNIVSVNLAKCG